jgi:plasmid stabilization system protein ParE
MYDVIVMPRAERELADAIAWWEANRPKNPFLLERELDELIGGLASYPNRGRPTSVVGERYVVAPQTSYRITYRVRPRAMRVEVLSIRHAAREW